MIVEKVTKGMQKPQQQQQPTYQNTMMEEEVSVIRLLEGMKQKYNK